jgi:PKD repeat protein
MNDLWMYVPDPLCGAPTGGTAMSSFTVDTLSLCDGLFAFHDSIDGYVVAWDFGDGFTSTLTDPIHAFAGAGSYEVSLIVEGCSSLDTATVILEVPVSIDVNLPADTLVCDSLSSVTLTASITPSCPSCTFLWNTGDTTASIIVDSAGTYSVVVTEIGGLGCTDTDTFRIELFDPYQLPSDTSFCFGDSITLSMPSSYSTYLWSTGASTSAITVAASGTYSVTVSEGACSFTDSTKVVMVPLPAVALASDADLCGSATLLLDPGPCGGCSYVWSTGATTPAIVVDSIGTYSVTITDEVRGTYCSNSDTITVSHIPSFSLPPDTTYCAGGGSTTLSVAGTYSTYLWSTGATTTSITVSTSGSYSVTATEGSCSFVDTMEVSVIGLPDADLGMDSILCGSASLVLDPGPCAGCTYAWSTGASSPTITVGSTGTYSLTLTETTSGLSCHSIDSIDVTAISLPTSAFTFSGSFPTLDFISLATSYDSLHWDFGDGGVSSLPNPSHTYAVDSGYWVCLTAYNACGDSTWCDFLQLTSTDQAPDDDFSFSPNPTTGAVRVVTPSHWSQSRWSVFTAEGKKVLEGSVQRQEFEIQLGEFADGAYWIQFELPAQWKVARIVKQ